MYKTLVAIQSELNSPKTLYNSFGKYHYRSAETILESLKPLLKKHNVSLTINDEVILVGERYYIKATATLMNDKGDFVSTSALAREDDSKRGMDSAQLTGATSSYARKYALNGLFAIDDNKDHDTNEFETENKQKQALSQPKQASTPKTKQSAEKAPKKTIEEVKELFFKIGGEKATEDSFSKWTDNMATNNVSTDQMYSMLVGKQ